MQIPKDILENPEAFKKFEQSQGALSSALGRLMVVSEKYPDLKSNQNFMALQSQLEGTENRIAVARKDYVETVQRSYALGLGHKHIPEMQAHAGLKHPPIFSPAVARFYRGMLVEVPLPLWALDKAKPRDVHAALADAYNGARLIEVAGLEEAAAMKSLDAEMLAGSNAAKLFVFANEVSGQARLAAVFDNLGKGAGGAAVQNLNLMLGVAETTGL